MANQVSGLVSIHRLRTGSTVQLYLDVTKGLYQMVTGSVITPDWSQTENQPVITPNVTGATLSNPRWYKDMPAGTSTSGRDGYRVVNGSDYRIEANGRLQFLKSPVQLNNVHNITYTFICDVTTGGTTEEIQRTIQVLCRQGGENSYWGQILAPQGTTLGQVIGSDGRLTERTSTELTPKLIQGSSEVSNFNVKWYKTGAGNNGADKEITSNTSISGCTLSGKKLIVAREAVDSMAHFECHYYVNGVLVEAEGIQISDNADEFFINVSGDKNVYTGSNVAVKLVAGVYKSADNSFVQCDNWAAVVTDSERMNEYNSDDFSIETGAGSEAHRGVFSMSESKMYVPNTSNGAYKDTSKKWLKCGDSASGDVAVANTSEATECDVNVQFVATF